MKNNENNNGYIIFSADGTKPNCTLAALKNDDCTQIIAEGKIPDFLAMLGSLARSIVTECNVPKAIVLSAVKAAIIVGDAWEGAMEMIARKPTDETLDKIMDTLTQE